MSNRILKDKVPDAQKVARQCAMPKGMEKKPKCNCRKANLPQSGRVVIRCERHRGKPSKNERTLCYWDADGIIRWEAPGA